MTAPVTMQMSTGDGGRGRRAESRAVTRAPGRLRTKKVSTRLAQKRSVVAIGVGKNVWATRSTRETAHRYGEDAATTGIEVVTRARGPASPLMVGIPGTPLSSTAPIPATPRSILERQQYTQTAPRPTA